MKELSALLALVLLVSPAHSEFTQEDRELLISLKVRMEEIDKRFEEIDKRFEQVDKRFEQIDKRFEQIDERFEFIQNILVAMFGVFGGLCAAFVGLLLWDRRTFKERSKVVKALRRFADVEPRMAEVLRSLGMIPPS